MDPVNVSVFYLRLVLLVGSISVTDATDGRLYENPVPAGIVANRTFSAVIPALVFLALPLPACSGGDGKNEDGGQADTTKPDTKQDPCKSYKEDGALCGGGATCRETQTCVFDGKDGASVCRTKCDPKGSNQCGGDLCGRTCVGLVDQSGKPRRNGFGSRFGERGVPIIFEQIIH